MPPTVVLPDKLLFPATVWSVDRSTKFWVVEPVPPLAMANVPVTLAAVPVVFWLSVGKSAATAMLGTPVVVVFINIPVARPAMEVPLICSTTLAPCVPVTSPAKLPVKEAAEPVTLVWSPVLVPLTEASKGTVNVLEVVPPAMVKPVAADVGVNPLIEVAEATPRLGVTKVGEVLITTLPVPVVGLETTFLDASVNKA